MKTLEYVLWLFLLSGWFTAGTCAWIGSLEFDDICLACMVATHTHD